jgi:hypothetical protein
MSSHTLNPGSFNRRKTLGTHLMGPRAGMIDGDREQFLPHPGIEPLFFCLPARSRVAITTGLPRQLCTAVVLKLWGATPKGGARGLEGGRSILSYR